MQATNIISETFNCTIERAFRTPIHGDVTKILVGYGIVPPVIGLINDETWGIAGGSRIPVMKGSIFGKSGPKGFDEILVREENKYWKWHVIQMPASAFFAKEAIGEWWVEEKPDGTVQAKWKYTWVARNFFTQPFNWLFVKIFWRVVMRNGIRNIKELAEKESPYIYNN